MVISEVCKYCTVFVECPSTVTIALVFADLWKRFAAVAAADISTLT